MIQIICDEDGNPQKAGYSQRLEIPWKDRADYLPENEIEVGTVIDKRVVTRNNDEFLIDIDLNVRNGKLEGNMNWKAPADASSSSSYVKTFEGGGVLKYKLKFESTFEYFADPDLSDPEVDSDGDGLTDAEEYEMSNDPDSWSVDGRAVPTRKDIFVEVDWMEGHEMKDPAKWRVGTRFLNNPTGEEIWLHIDDGLMGGGEEITEKDTTGFYDKDGDNNDFYDYKWGNGWDTNDNGIVDPVTDDLHGYFDQNRWGKFHYCLFANDAERSSGSNHMGIAEYDPGNYTDDLIIGDDNWHKSVPEIVRGIFGLSGVTLCPKGSDSTVQAAIFMHELGHNLGLKFTGGYQIAGEEGYQPYGHHSCMNYYYILSYVNYANSEWDTVIDHLNDIGKGNERWD